MTFLPAVRYRARLAAGYKVRAGSVELGRRFAEGTGRPPSAVSTASTAGLSRRPFGAGWGMPDGGVPQPSRRAA